VWRCRPLASDVAEYPDLRARSVILALSLIVMSGMACGAAPIAETPNTSAMTIPVTPLASATRTTPSPESGLFIAVDSSRVVTPPAHAARSRIVKVNLRLLLDDNGKPRALGPNAQIVLNLFPDVTYVGVIENMQQEGGGTSWVGHLQGVENSRMYLVYTAGVFIGHFASPAGVYEVSNIGGNLYRIVMIDQSQLQGGDEPTPFQPTSIPG
jgi:hypothetical protein